MTRSIVQLVPSAPPIIGGVGDFALEVAGAMRTERGIDSIFVICNVDWNGPDSIDGFRMVPFRSRESGDLCKVLETISPGAADPLAVLVQLSAYGFSENGAPFWLLRALHCWKERDQKRKLVIFFHELFAMSPPWKRGFWLSPFQRRCARGMAALSDASFTSMQEYLQTLRRWDPSRASAYACLGIPSNVGEPRTLPAPDHRRRRMVVFGSVGIRSRAYSRATPTFMRVCDLLNVDEIVDIGDGEPRGVENLPVGKVTRLGALGAGQISAVLAESRFGYLDYYSGYLAKSGIFAAYCAHGLVPILPVENRSEADGVMPEALLVSRAGEARFRVNEPDLGGSQCLVPTTLRPGACTPSFFCNSRNLTVGDLIILWEYRERAPLLTRYWLKLWAKRIWTGPALLGILFRRARLRSRGAAIGSLSVIAPANIEGKLELLQIGRATFVGRANIALHASVTIGNFAVISDSATLLTGTHSLNDPDWGLVALPIEVGNYAWIGQGATVLPGVIIGTGAVVGACAVVSQSVEAFTVVVGNPARAVGTKRPSDLRYVPVTKVAPFIAWLGAGSKLASDISRS